MQRHEQKDGGQASDEGVTELYFARGMGLGCSPFMAPAEEADKLRTMQGLSFSFIPRLIMHICPVRCARWNFQMGTEHIYIYK